ncbi:uncharacterized protein OCT59_017318 [Rhizophagus irregularis]|uniref:Myb/SANT-like DNA-binding domain-containing protein n=1 Tax=Rhizophagus irregularis (strain DAOM 197198w) TaxID=1432141 RepID=A0A015KGT7_RHIIW|nr:hypothetical protein RirG_011040 [Rhizophagus irregularis DAOM 197198w]UZO25031.1 hypothetical protein OCT59_017318 [Rhizophagus irregularis]GBC50276.2 hypothetical protein GLOIN_2v1567919 [Rhizophagus irregularis DAOM 181602=DAOM 197198]
MEFLKDPLNNPQVNISYKNNKLVRPIKPRNLYPSPFTGIFKQSNVDLYQNPLLKRQSHVSPSFYIQNGSSFGQSFFGPNYFENIVGNKVSDVEINYQQEKKKINDEKESTDVNYKKKSNNKRKFGNEGESNNNWQVYEVDILLQYIADNFDEYTKGNKTKLFNEISIKVLKNKELNAIKSKLARMIKYYDEVKAYNEKSGVERKDWDWYEKMDAIFNTCKNIAPSFIVNRSTDIDGKESSGIEPKIPKRSKKNNVDTIAMAISTMSETRERIWEKKIELKKERIEKNHTIEMDKLEVEKQKWEFEKEKMKWSMD